MRENDLVNCVACGRRIGYNAPRCPQCGQIQPAPGKNISTVQGHAKGESAGIVSILGAVLVIGGVLFLVAGVMKIIAGVTLGHGLAPGTFLIGGAATVAGAWCLRSVKRTR